MVQSLWLDLTFLFHRVMLNSEKKRLIAKACFVYLYLYIYIYRYLSLHIHIQKGSRYSALPDQTCFSCFGSLALLMELCGVARNDLADLFAVHAWRFLI